MNRLATIFSIITTAGILLAAGSGVAWIVAALRHRETVAKALCLAGVIVAVLGFILFLRSYDSSLHQERAQESEPPITQSIPPEQPQEPAQGPVLGQEGSTQGNTLPEPQKPTEAPQEPEQVANAVNPLLALEVHTRPVMNGLKTEQIGTWAYIETTKEFMAGVTGQQLHDYLSELSAEEYNWFNVFFEDGTGLWTFSPVLIEYGQADRDEGGSVEYIGEPEECIFTFSDGQYSTEN